MMDHTKSKIHKNINDLKIPNNHLDKGTEIKRQNQKEAKELSKQYERVKSDFSKKYKLILSTDEIKNAISDKYKHLSDQVERFKKEHESDLTSKNKIQSYRESVIKLELYVKSDLEGDAKSRIEKFEQLKQTQKQLEQKYTNSYSKENDSVLEYSEYKKLSEDAVNNMQQAKENYLEENIVNFENSLINLNAYVENSLIKLNAYIENPEAYRERNREFVDLLLDSDLPLESSFTNQLEEIEKTYPQIAKVLKEVNNVIKKKIGTLFSQFDARHTADDLAAYRQSIEEYSNFFAKAFYYAFSYLEQKYQLLIYKFQKTKGTLNEQSQNKNVIEQAYQKIIKDFESSQDEYNNLPYYSEKCALDDPQKEEVLTILESAVKNINNLEALINDAHEHIFKTLQQEYQSLNEKIEEYNHKFRKYVKQDQSHKCKPLKEQFEDHQKNYQAHPTSEALEGCDRAIADLKKAVRKTMVDGLNSAHNTNDAKITEYINKLSSSQEQRIAGYCPQRFKDLQTRLGQAGENLKKLKNNSSEESFTTSRHAVIELLDAAENPITWWNLTRVKEQAADNKKIAQKAASIAKGAFGAKDRKDRVNDLINLFNAGLGENEKKLATIKSLSQEDQKAFVEAHTAIVDTFSKMASQAVDYSKSHNYRENSFNYMKQCESIIAIINNNSPNWGKFIQEQQKLAEYSKQEISELKTHLLNT